MHQRYNGVAIAQDYGAVEKRPTRATVPLQAGADGTVQYQRLNGSWSL